MAYDLQLVQINANARGLAQGGTSWGFPAFTNFHTLLMSFWMCGPANTSGVAGVWPEFNSARFFTFAPGSNGIGLTNQAIGPSTYFYQGSFNLPPPPGMLMHFLMSVDTHAQVVQLYINDHPITITGGAWTGTPPFDFTLGTTGSLWFWDVSGVLISGLYPALGDVWMTNPPAFVDLSVAANRRKFITAGYSPVDLGATGTNPFGTQPALYMSVRPGGVPADILTNLGLGGGTWNYDQNPPTFQAPGSCTLPPAPPKLAIDDVNCTTIPELAVNEVYLEWSDDRGHSYGNPVGHPMGDAGQYLTSVQYQRLGYGRDRVFRIFWSVPMKTALQGAWVEAEPAQS